MAQPGGLRVDPEDRPDRRPRFSLGGQVSSHNLTSSASSNLDLAQSGSEFGSDPYARVPETRRKLHRHSMSSLILSENDLLMTPDAGKI